MTPTQFYFPYFFNLDKFNKLLFALVLLLFLTHCQSPSDQIKKAFDTVDKSLEKSNSVLNNSIDGLYSTINSVRQKNEPLALKADTIYFVTKQTSNYIDSLKEIMQLQDTLGNNLSVATKLLVFTPTGDILGKALLNVYTNAKSYPIENARQSELDSTLQSFQEIQNNKDWTKIYFEKTPTVAAMTILSKFQNDCKNVATITLTHIKKRFTE